MDGFKLLFVLKKFEIKHLIKKIIININIGFT
jgi:hypothetical protein